MLEIYYKNGKDKTIQTIPEFKEGTWIHVENPTRDELLYLEKTLKLDQSLLVDALDRHEIPRIEIEDGIVYIFTRFAYSKDKQITTAPMLIAIGKHFIATISPSVFPRLSHLLNEHTPATTHKIRLLLKILHQIQETFNYSLHIITKNVRTFTFQLEKIRNQDIVQFVLFENDLHDFNLALIKTNNDINNIMLGKILPLTQPEHDQIEDIYLNNSQLIDICNENIRTIVNLREAYSTIMTNNLNRIIKLFTSLTVILTIPTIISSLFGMNVALPELSFMQIVQSTALICVLVLIFFTYKDWL